jgi:PAS domain-containing protein
MQTEQTEAALRARIAHLEAQLAHCEAELRLREQHIAALVANEPDLIPRHRIVPQPVYAAISLADALLLIDTGERVLLANQAATALCRREPDGLVGRHWRDISPFDSPLIAQAPATRTAVSTSASPIELLLVEDDDAARHSLTRVLARSGSIVAAVGSAA